MKINPKNRDVLKNELINPLRDLQFNLQNIYYLLSWEVKKVS